MGLSGPIFYAIVALYLLVLVGVLYVCVFADPDESPLALYITETLPTKTWTFLQRILPKSALGVLEFMIERSLQIVYLVIFLGTFSITVFYIFPMADALPDHVAPMRQKIVVGILAALTWWSWQKASNASPGIVTARNLQRYSHFPYDEILFVPGVKCKTRGFVRPARSKFDRYKYKENIPRFDHYCGWVNNSIGEENYRYFLLFLAFNVLDCFYGTIMMYRLFYGHCKERDLLDAIFVDRHTGEEVPVSTWILFQYLFDRFTLEMGVFLLVSVMSIAIGLFLLYHVRLTSVNMTTNESYKWDSVRKWHKTELKRYNDALARGEAVIGPNGNNNKSSSSPKEQQELPATAVTTNDSDKNGEVPASSPNDATPLPAEEDENVIRHPGPTPKNIYDRGFVENWKEVVFPISLRTSGDAKEPNSRTSKPKVT